MPISWTLKNIFVMLVGLGLLGWGAWLGLAAYTRLFGIGLGLVGLATMALGMTGGFMDTSPATSMISKLGTLAYALGLPIVIYGIWHLG